MINDIFIGINYSHDGSVCVIHKGEIVYFNEEERYDHRKHTFSYAHSLHEAFQLCEKLSRPMRQKNIKHKIRSSISSIYSHNTHNVNNQDNVAELLMPIYNEVFCLLSGWQTVKKYEYVPHHEAHANLSFYNSGFDEALVLVIDGGGEGVICGESSGKTGESIYYMNYDKTWYLHQRSLSIGTRKEGETWGVLSNDYFDVATITDRDTYGRIFTRASEIAVNDGFGAGKLMGLAAYGKDNPDVPDAFKTLYPCTEFRIWLKENKNEIKTGKIPPEDVAFRVQNQSTESIIEYIDMTLKLMPSKNVCLCGGFFYNVVNNYKILKAFPDINFYFEPIAGDQGVAIGAAMHQYRKISKDKTKRPLKTLYLGRQANYDRDLLPNEKEIHDVEPSYVAKLLEQRNVVALYQGRAEAGPRALGNRSLLYDPRDPNGRDVVNTIKKREWYRPFAGTVLEEHAKEWFDLAELDSSPWMMFAVECYEDKQKLVPALQHNDGTSRIQTLNQEQNQHYYDLIQEFYKLTNVPMVLNTSFNLAGDTMVDNMQDALRTCRKGNIPYLYCPERKMLIDFKGYV